MSAQAQTQPVDIVLLPGTVDIPDTFRQPVRAALNRNSARLNGTRYALVTAFDCEAGSGICFVSISGFVEAPDPATWKLENVAAIETVVLNRRANGSIDGVLASEDSFSAMTADMQSPRMEALRIARSQTQTLSYDLPWQAGTAMTYGTLGIHRGGFVDGWLGVDLLSNGDVPAGRAPNSVLAAAAGTVTYVCNDGVNVAIRIGDLIYVHLLENDKLRVGQRFERGDEIGQLKAGSFNARCGYASQRPENFHLHLAFPNTDRFDIGGWSLSRSDGVWRSGDRSVRPGQALRNDVVPPGPTATADPLAPPTSTPTPSPTRGPTATPTPLPTLTSTPTASPTPTITPSPTPSPSPTPVPGACELKSKGDANCDDAIDGLDFGVWLITDCTRRCSDLRADFNRDRRVDSRDYDQWRRNRTGGANDPAEPGFGAQAVARNEAARLILRPVDPARRGNRSIALKDGESVDLELQLVFSPTLPVRRLYYTRLEFALPSGVIALAPEGGVAVRQSELDRVIALTSPDEANRTGRFKIELAAQNTRGLPTTPQTVILARFRVRSGPATAAARLMLMDAQVVTSGAKSWPVRYEAVTLLTNPVRTFLPLLRR
jgi:hypothetical protein